MRNNSSDRFATICCTHGRSVMHRRNKTRPTLRCIIVGKMSKMNLVECSSLTALVRYTLYMTSSGASSGHVEYYEFFTQKGASSGRWKS